VHTLYFPGTPWIYPPLFQIILSMPIIFGAPPLQTVFTLGLAFDILQALPLFVLGRRLGGSMVGWIVALLYAIDASHVYPLTWGGYPNLMASFLIAIAVVLLTESEWMAQLELALMIVLIGLTHHLSLAVVVAIICINVAILFHRKDSRHALHKLLAMVLGLTVLTFWYVPRLQLYLSLIPTGPSLPGLLSQGIVRTVGLFVVTFGLGGLLVLATLFFILRYPPVREASPVLSWFLGPLLLAVPFVFTPNISIRLLYYATPPALVVFATVLTRWIRSPSTQVSNLRTRTLPWATLSKRGKIFLLLLLVIFGAGESLWTSENAHDFYRNNNPDIMNITKWSEQTHAKSGTTIAPLVPAMYIAAISSKPVVAVGDPVWFSLMSEREMVADAHIILTTPPSNQTFRDYVCRMNVTYIVFDGPVPSWVPNNVQRVEYASGNYTIVSVNENC